MKRLFFVIIIFFIGVYDVILPPTVEPFSDNQDLVLFENYGKKISRAKSLERSQSKNIPSRPRVEPFSDNRDWVLVKNLEYSIGNSNVKISVPKGFVTDFASIPRPLWPMLSPYGKYSRAAIVHDYLYWQQECTREQADRILLIAMKESGVSRTQCAEIYAGVRAGGGPAWESNKKEKEAGLPKIIPPNRLNFPDNVNWKEYRRILFNDGVRDPLSNATPAYCAFGNSADIPE
jgi:hypothetical protein